MMHQTRATNITDTATLTYAQIGIIVVTGAGSVTLTLPSAKAGAWFTVINLSAGAVTIGDVELQAGETGYCVSNGATAWWVTKAGAGGGSGNANITLITTSTTLTDEQIGDIVANAEADIEIVLPTPFNGAYYRIYNVSSYIVGIDSGIEYVNIELGESCTCLAINDTWFVSYTKLVYPSFENLSDLYDSYAGNAGKFVKVTDEEDGIEFADAQENIWGGF